MHILLYHISHFFDSLYYGYQSFKVISNFFFHNRSIESFVVVVEFTRWALLIAAETILIVVQYCLKTWRTGISRWLTSHFIPVCLYVSGVYLCLFFIYLLFLMLLFIKFKYSIRNGCCMNLDHC